MRQLTRIKSLGFYETHFRGLVQIGGLPPEEAFRQVGELLDSGHPGFIFLAAFEDDGTGYKLNSFLIINAMGGASVILQIGTVQKLFIDNVLSMLTHAKGLLTEMGRRSLSWVYMKDAPEELEVIEGTFDFKGIGRVLEMKFDRENEVIKES